VISQFGHCSRGETVTPPRCSFHSRRPRKRASLVSTPPGEGNEISDLAFKQQKTHLFDPAAQIAPELCKNFRPHKTEGAGKAGCPLHPQPRMQNEKAYE
jgi:hypothetical protein